MAFLSDAKVLYHLLLSPVRGATHAQRLESFYRGQADTYDAFRQRLLQGRAELIDRLDLPEGGVWVDLGGGTGSNFSLAGTRLRRLKRAYAVDLSPSLLDVAQKRRDAEAWHNVELVEADATRFVPDDGPADVVTFSYSLTMIPDWFAALENARKLLRPGGQIGVVDFHVSRKYPEEGLARHGWATRLFWPAWFAADNVFLSPDHLPWLRRHFAPEACEELRARVPYLPGLRVPYYRFVGRAKA